MDFPIDGHSGIIIPMCHDQSSSACYGPYGPYGLTEAALDQSGREWSLNPGDGAFYGVWDLRDGQGWSLATQIPGKKNCPVFVHVRFQTQKRNKKKDLN